jgi:hypothetical protein
MWFPHDWDALGLQPKGVPVSSAFRKGRRTLNGLGVRGAVDVDLVVWSIEAQDKRAHKRAGGRPFTSESAREAAGRSAEARRQARKGAGLSDQDIEQALRRKAAKGDVAAARELRERARVKLDVATENTPRVELEDMSSEELERLRERLLRMAVRMNERAARAQARADGAAPPRASESRP